MDWSSNNRSSLLPEGCKDLIDALNLKVQLPSKQVSLPSIKGELPARDKMTVRELAAILHKKPFQIVADLMPLGVFANVEQVVDFKTITQLFRKHGYIAVNSFAKAS